MSVLIRAARPEDADAVAPLVFGSGPDVARYILCCGDSAILACLRRGFARNAGEFGCGVHVVAEVSGQIVGAGAGFGGDAPLRFLIEGLLNIVAAQGVLQTPGITRRALQVEHVIRPPTRHEQCIAHLGVAPEFRSRGIGALIVQRIIEDGKRAGRRMAVLDVSVENPRAQALYERLGFVVAREYPPTLRNRHAAVPGHRRMELALSP